MSIDTYKPTSMEEPSDEILEVYPGASYDDTVIAELYFDGIDVH